MPRARAEGPQYQSREFEHYAGAFRFYSLGASLQEVGHLAVPDLAINHFNQQSRRYIDQETYLPLDFHELLLIRYPHTDIHTWVAWNSQFIDHIREIYTHFYLFDTPGQEKSAPEIGHSEIAFSLTSRSPFHHDRPYVGWNGTEANFLRQGHGLRRLIVMNALCMAQFRLPLNSDVVHNLDTKVPVRMMWEKLVSHSLALPQFRPTDDGEPQRRYVFIDNPQAYVKKRLAVVTAPSEIIVHTDLPRSLSPGERPL